MMLQPIDRLKALIETERTSAQEASQYLGVAPSTVTRWVQGGTVPKNGIRRDLANLVARIEAGEDLVSTSHSDAQGDVAPLLAEVLRGLRESLHRHGRLGGRHEVLDEVCKLVFAHLSDVKHGGHGINRKDIDHLAPEQPSKGLSLFVERCYSQYVHPSLLQELSPARRKLGLGQKSDSLALDVIQVFERLAEASGIEGSLGATDVLNEVFGRFLAGSFVDEKELGQYLTPPEVVAPMVTHAINSLSQASLDTLLDPDKCAEFGAILDPSCGVGSFLTETVRQLELLHLAQHGDARVDEWRREMATEVIWGFDKSERMVNLAITSFAASGMEAANLHCIDALASAGDDGETSGQLKGKVGLLLSNPPFGAEVAGKDLISNPVIMQLAVKTRAKIASELAFTARYLEWLAPGGVCNVVLPDSILTNRGQFAEFRSALHVMVDLQAIVSLPAVTFAAAGTSTKTSTVLFARQGGQDSSQRVPCYFAMCNDIGFTIVTKGSQRTKRPVGRSQLPLIVDEATRHSSRHAFGRRVPNVEDLHRWDALYHSSLPEHIQQKLDNPPKEAIWVRNVAELISDRTSPKHFGQDPFPYVEISDIDGDAMFAAPKAVRASEAPSRARKLACPGDLLVATVRPERRQIAVLRENQPKCIVTTGLAVLRPSGIDPLLLGRLLKSDFATSQILRNNVGIAYPAVDETVFLDIMLPIRRKDIDAMADCVADLESAERTAHQAREVFERRMVNSIGEFEGG